MGRIDILEIKKAITFFIFLWAVLFTVLAWPVYFMGGNLMDVIYWSVAISLIITIMFGLCENNE